LSYSNQPIPESILKSHRQAIPQHKQASRNPAIGQMHACTIPTSQPSMQACPTHTSHLECAPELRRQAIPNGFPLLQVLLRSRLQHARFFIIPVSVAGRMSAGLCPGSQGVHLPATVALCLRRWCARTGDGCVALSQSPDDSWHARSARAGDFRRCSGLTRQLARPVGAFAPRGRGYVRPGPVKPR
jgi:hypothetical protein